MREGEENEGKMWEAVVSAMNFVVGMATTKKKKEGEEDGEEESAHARIHTNLDRGTRRIR